MDFIVGIVSQNLAITSHFVEFGDNRNFTFFEAQMIIWDTWHMMSGSQSATYKMQGKSNKEPKWDP